MKCCMALLSDLEILGTKSSMIFIPSHLAIAGPKIFVRCNGYELRIALHILIPTALEKRTRLDLDTELYGTMCASVCLEHNFWSEGVVVSQVCDCSFGPN
jgi:hypothetical protein